MTAKKIEDKISQSIRLKVLIEFIDKYTEVEYKINDEIDVESARAEELLSDERRLVERLN